MSDYDHTYTIDVSGLHMVIVIEADSEEEALEAIYEGHGRQELLWDDAEYTVRDEEQPK